MSHNEYNNNNNELYAILEPLSVDKLKELRQYVEYQTIPMCQGELIPFFEWRAKQTSITKNHALMVKIINKVLNKKECEEKEEQPSPRNQSTQDRFNGNNYDEKRSNLNRNAPEYVPQLGTTLSHGSHQSLGSIAEHQETPPLSSVSSNNSLPRTQSPLTQSPLTQSPSPLPFVDVNSMMRHNDALMKQAQDNLARWPVPQGHGLLATPLSTPLSPVSSSAPQQQQQQQQQQQLNTQVTQCMISSVPMTQCIVSSPATSVPNMMIHGTNQFNGYTSAQQQQQQQIPSQQRNDQNYDINNKCTQPTEFKQDQNEYRNCQENNRLNTSPFNPKFNNHAKGNFYISKEMISRMINESNEEFITNNNYEPDEKLAFGHYKESVAMQINDNQIKVIKTKQGLMIIINIDLHFKSNNNDIMYLIAMENDKQFRERVRWCIKDFMSAAQIKINYGLNKHQLPKSSRNQHWYKRAMRRAPINLSQREINKIIRETRFKSLPSKTSKRRQTGNERINSNKSRISINNLKYYVEKSLYNDNFPIHPVVVIKGKNQWIEWKRYIELFDDNNNKQYVGISMKYYDSNKQWKIECMDYDAGRVFYQHRLASLPKNDEFSYSYNQLSRFITTTLDIYHSHRWH